MQSYLPGLQNLWYILPRWLSMVAMKEVQCHCDLDGDQSDVVDTYLTHQIHLLTSLSSGFIYHISKPNVLLLKYEPINIYINPVILKKGRVMLNWWSMTFVIGSCGYIWINIHVIHVWTPNSYTLLLRRMNSKHWFSMN